MSSTNILQPMRFDKEKEIIKKVAYDVKNGGFDDFNDEVDNDSYYLSGERLKKFMFTGVREYNPASPLEFKIEFETLWKKRGTPNMKEFINVCIVSCMKAKENKVEHSPQRISETIYEF